jgi:formate hydrogenlyase subunit 3/multisubunit Na+/H+ antiporter MnhD subunit
VTVLWVLLPALPALAVLLLLGRGTASWGARLLPWAPVPALLLSLLAREGEARAAPWLMLEGQVGLDLAGRGFLFFTALLWIAAGLFARAYIGRSPGWRRHHLFHLVTLLGNLGVVVALDAATFYASFAVMTFAAYGLIVHDGTAPAHRAGGVYVGLAVAGEAAILAGMVLSVRAAGTLSLAGIPAAVAAAPDRDWIVGLVLLGFGIKAGALFLHVWLPLAHPAAPTAASAVLSGAMIKAGLLGWIRFLPLGEAALPGWGGVLIAAGLGAAFYGVLVGLVQEDSKVKLAYSSISQMGFLNVGVGIGLTSPDAAPLVLTSVVVYALHHGLAKGSLFLGVGVARSGHEAGRRRGLLTAGLGLGALALAGAPLTSGHVAKTALKDAAALAPGGWYGWLNVLLPLAAVGTTLLMGRFLWVVLTREVGGSAPGSRGLWLPWALLLAATPISVWVAPLLFALEETGSWSLSLEVLWTSAWPVAVGLALLWLGRDLLRRRETVRVPPGDLLVVGERALGALRSGWSGWFLPALDLPPVLARAAWTRLLIQPTRSAGGLEGRLVRWTPAAVAFLAVLMALLVLLS